MLRFLLLLVLAVICTGCSAPSDDIASSSATNKTCAVVNGAFLDTKELEDLAVAAYGNVVLEDMVLLELATAHARTKGITLTDAMYKAELDSFLTNLAPDKDRQTQQRLFEFMLKKRNMTTESFDLVLKKQALLKACVDSKVEITQEKIDKEYKRQYGQQRIIRLVAVDSLRKMEEFENLLAAGDRFSVLAGQYSQDELSLRNDGLVGPISEVDDVYPAAVVSHGFALAKPGDISESFAVVEGPVQKWYKMQLEKVIPALGVDPASCRADLEKSIIRNEIAERVVLLQDKLRSEAKVIIMDKRLGN